MIRSRYRNKLLSFRRNETPKVIKTNYRNEKIVSTKWNLKKQIFKSAEIKIFNFDEVKCKVIDNSKCPNELFLFRQNRI